MLRETGRRPGFRFDHGGRQFRFMYRRSSAEKFHWICGEPQHRRFRYYRDGRFGSL